MKIKSVSDIPSALFYNLKTWSEASSTNFNILVGVSTLLLCLAILGYILLARRIGESDERTNGIYKNFAFILLIVFLICDVLFPRTYLTNQFLVYKYALALIAGDIYLLIQYRRDYA